MSEKKNKPHVIIGVVGHTDYNRTLLNDAIRKTLEQNPDQIPNYDPIDVCISSASKINILNLANNPISDPVRSGGIQLKTTKKTKKKHQKRRK